MNPLTHFTKTRTLLHLIAPALVAVALFSAGPARATALCDVVTETLAVGHYPDGLLDLMCRQLPGTRQPWYLHMNVRGDSDVYVTRHTFQPGGQTGWHSHPGPSLITVIEGTLTVYHDDCTFETYSAGESFTDLGCGDIHNVRNEGATEAMDVAVQIVPAGASRRDDKPDPGCANVPPCPPF